MADARREQRLLIAVLVKDFESAKTRLAGALSPAERVEIARENAVRAVRAAVDVAPTVAVCGSAEAAAAAAAQGASVIIEAQPQGQNPAGRTAIEAAVSSGAAAVLLLSSDLPLVDAAALRAMIERGDAAPEAVAVAAAAIGRSGTNALYLRPPSGFELHFGAKSLQRFAAEARLLGRGFIVHQDPRLGLDLDEPADLLILQWLQGAA